MKWVGISGSWRVTDAQVEHDVRLIVKETLKNGHGIVAGGALGVDYIATDEALSYDLKGDQIKVYLPTSLQTYCAHFFNRAKENVISPDQAESISKQLEILKSRNPDALIEMDFSECTPQTYYARNQKVIDASTSLFAFHVNKSEGVQDAIDRAKSQNKPITVKSYTL